MYQKGYKFYADWRDVEGTRHRKSFSTAKAAQAYEASMRTANPKTKARGQLRKSSSPKLGRANRATLTPMPSARPASSSQRQEASSRKNFTQRTSTISTRQSASQVIPMQRASTPRPKPSGFSKGWHDSIKRRNSRT